MRTTEISAAGQTTCPECPPWSERRLHRTRPTGRLATSMCPCPAAVRGPDGAQEGRGRRACGSAPRGGTSQADRTPSSSTCSNYMGERSASRCRSCLSPNAPVYTSRQAGPCLVRPGGTGRLDDPAVREVAGTPWRVNASGSAFAGRCPACRPRKASL
jgi:hypothetical protein